jgi:UDP-hydrolysing UDP-N-acetyl-D-glucosamine 2-epimerase
MKKKICFVIASRANYGRIKSVLLQIKKSKKLILQIILTASSLLEKYGDLRALLRKDGFHFLEEAFVIVEGENNLTMAKSTGLSIIELSSAFSRLKPNVVVTVGDRYESLATAIAASYMNITLAHIQGGEITGSIDESVRHAVTKLSHMHFAATEKAKKNIIRMGEDKRYVFNVGCPSLDLINENKNLLKIKDLRKGVGKEIMLNNPYLLVVFHPVTTEYNEAYNQTRFLADIVDKLDMQTIWMWPNIDSGTDKISKCLRQYREKGLLKNVHFYKNFQVDDYNVILKNTACAVGNSSSFIREGSYLGVPAIILGTRQDNRESYKNLIRCSFFNKKKIINLIYKQMNKKYRKSKLYGNGKSALKITKLLEKLSPPIQKKLKY